MSIPFQNRSEAGQLLAGKLIDYKNRSDALVLALPRGGVPVGLEVALVLEAPLDVFLVRKLGVPGHEELAFGAIATGGVRVLLQDIVHSYRISQGDIEAVAGREHTELERRERLYRGGLPASDPAGRTVILVDDGLATGATMLAAVRALRKENPKQIIVGVPVASIEACDDFRPEVDKIVCAATPDPFYAVGFWYRDFTQTTDEEVHRLLEQADAATRGVRS